MDNRTVGSKYEEVAKQYLIENGAEIITTNYHFHKMGEIDIIYYDYVIENGIRNKYLCFGEVKYRTDKKAGGAIYAVDYKKQKKISKVAIGYIKQYSISLDHLMRFDVIAIDGNNKDGNNIDWIKNAFSYVE
ncbi:MAG: YraN family protein [Lachnospiraceae bacterium]|nr:YraN family protein [Lachnospiraceae bacterium]